MSPKPSSRLVAAGHEVLYVTNNASRTIAEQERRLAAMGIDAAGRLVTAAQAAAALVDPGERVLVIGGPGVHEALGERRAVVVSDGGQIDTVVCGLDLEFDYAALAAASRALRAGARFVLTNDDPSFPGPLGMEPGAGALAAAIRVASEVDPIVAGKPWAPMAALVRARVSGPALVVGDRTTTDGAFAARLGMQFGLVLSGATGAAEAAASDADHVAADLPTLVERLCAP